MTSMPRNFLECKTFEDLEKSASIKELTPQERAAYDHSLKVLRDNYYIADHERKQGRIEGRIEGKLGMIKKMLIDGMDFDKIAFFSDMSVDDITRVAESMN